MKLLKADNYQTWYIEENDESILIDPWLTNQLQPDGSLFIQRNKLNASCLSNEDISKVKAIIITAPFEDHLNFDSIKMFPENTPIYTSKIVKMAIKNKLLNPINILNEEGSQICSMKIKALPTSYPYYSTTFSLLIEDDKKNKIFHEGHIVNFKYLLKNNIKADVAILTAEEVKLFGLISLGMNYKNTLKACELLQARNLFITGNNPENTKGLISNFLKTRNLLIDKLNQKFNLFYKAGDQIDLNNSLN
tara:strand:+ start:888 stop:1634 length:747 start_codon:yes stop_codon:yes gene_type:complete